MNIHYVTHVPFEGLGSIEDWIIKHNYTASCTNLYNNEILPQIKDVDFLIILGGPMSVHDEKEYPWLKKEKIFIEKAIKEDKIILGICLGAQLLAQVLGAEVYPNTHKEIGWFPISKTGTPPSPFNKLITDGEPVFHWHGETFSIPSGSVHLAQSEACGHQAFIFEEKIVGLQYHLEMTHCSTLRLINNCFHELKPAPYIQSRDEMLSQINRFTRSNYEMDLLLDYLVVFQ